VKDILEILWFYWVIFWILFWMGYFCFLAVKRALPLLKRIGLWLGRIFLNENFLVFVIVVFLPFWAPFVALYMLVQRIIHGKPPEYAEPEFPL